MAGLVGAQPGAQVSPEAAQLAAAQGQGGEGDQSQNPIANGVVPNQAKNAIQAQARAAAEAQAAAAGQKGKVFPNTEGALRAKSEQSATGTITGAFVAGPNEPWKGAWAFGGSVPPQVTQPNSAGAALAKLRESLASGGDETQIKQAGADATEALAAYLDQVGGQVEGADANADGKMAQPKGGLVGGQDFLAMIQGGRNGGANAQGDGGGLGGGFGGQSQAQQARMVDGANAQPAQFTLIQGGLDSNVLDGKAKSSKDSESSQGHLAFGGMTTQQLMDGPRGGHAPQPAVVAGNVVPGSMMRDRLTTDSLHNVASTIRGMSGKGGGEMRIRMNPGNLGELAIRVQTDGKSVGLHVTASDAGAKKILEESLSSLKDGLAAQNLSLGRVEIGVNTQMDAQNQNSQQQHASAQNFAGGMTGWDSGQGQSQGRYSNDEGSGYAAGFAAEPARAASSARYSPRSTGTSSRLDVMA